MKVEFAYFRQTHKPDIITWLDLFKLNKISNEERLENLMILLSDRDNLTGTVVDLPTNADVLQMITRDITHKARKDAATLLPEINDLYIVAWAVDGRQHWFLGYVKEKDDGHYTKQTTLKEKVMEMTIRLSIPYLMMYTGRNRSNCSSQQREMTNMEYDEKCASQEILYEKCS